MVRYYIHSSLHLAITPTCQVSLGMVRASVGVQSLDDDQLRRCGRGHDAAQAVEALRLLRPRLSRLSADLLCGLPGQRPEQLQRDLRELDDLQVARPRNASEMARKQLENSSKRLGIGPKSRETR